MSKRFPTSSFQFFGILFACAALVLAPTVGSAVAHAAKSLKGQIIISDETLETSYPSEEEMVAGLKKAKKDKIQSADGTWTVNFVIFLNKAPGADLINLVFYDTAKKGKREPVEFIEVSVKPTQDLIQLGGRKLTADMGFQSGHKYDVLATRLIGGKEKVLAKTTVTLEGGEGAAPAGGPGSGPK